MGTRAFSNHIALGAWVIVGATSCTPAPDGNLPQALAQPISDPKLLLSKLGLDIPAGALAGTALKPVADALGGTLMRSAPAFLEAARTPDDAARALDCLTAAVYYEARSENEDGQRAVAQVVLNRVRNRAFPASVCGVVYQGSQRRTGCQFTFTCDGSLYHPREPNAWERAKTVAEAALSGSVYTPVGSATSYHTTAILPWWAPSLTRITTIGSHIFYRWRSALENALGFGQDYAGIEPDINGGGYAGASDVANAFGIDVHYGNAPQPTGLSAEADGAPVAGAGISAISVNGVTIHRGGSTNVALAPSAPVAVAGTPVLADEPPSASPDTAHGVRIHRATTSATTPDTAAAS